MRDFRVGEKAQVVLAAALDEISTAVGSTIGPGGRPFGFDKLGVDMRLTSTFSKDGLTVLKALSFDEPAWQAILQYCRQAASHSVLSSGDGTTSTIMLANAVCKAVMNSRSKYPQSFARMLEADALVAIAAIRKEAVKNSEVVKQVALTATNGDAELTAVVLDAIEQSSAFGSILVEKNPASPLRYKTTRQDGYSNCAGYAYNSTFALSAASSAASSKPIDWDKPSVAVLNGNLILLSQLDPILKAWNESVKNGTTNKLVILAYEVSDEVVNKLLVLNRQMAQHDTAVFVVKPRLTAEINSGMQILRDIAAFCGIEDKKIIDGGNLKEVDATFLGTCEKIKITNNNTMFLGRAPNHWVECRVVQNQSIIEEARSDFDRHITNLRNAELAEGLVKVEVGGGLLPDLQERADRFDDASKAAQSCMRSGALPGAGCSYIRASVLAAVHPALAEAFRSIHNAVMLNYGVEPNIDFVPLRGTCVFIDSDGIEVGNAAELGVWDAAETVYSVIQHGVALGVKIATIGGYSYRQVTSANGDAE